MVLCSKAVKYTFVFPAHPVPCLSGCFCYYSIDDNANTINCSYFNLTQPPEKLLPNTEQLIMLGNPLHYVTFPEGTSHLKAIEFQQNNINKISSDAFQKFLLHTDSLNLSKNKLHKIPRLGNMSQFSTQLRLGDNPYECNCEMMWMRDWLLNATNVKDKENIICIGGKWSGMYFCCKTLKFKSHPNSSFLCFLCFFF